MTECWSKWIATTWMDQLNPLIASSESQMATDVSLHRRLMINHDNGGHYIVRTRTVKEKLEVNPKKTLDFPGLALLNSFTSIFNRH
ncbi:MAG: hypothetical protein OSB45_15480 [Pseudomonadales bacterium]|nr:hypothetical protein [Pseudomonadales bacterium]